MSNPIRQHYIPRSYLKNFATKKDKKIFLVDAYNLEADSLNKNISTKDICCVQLISATNLLFRVSIGLR